MAPELKAFYDTARVARLGAELVEAWPAFPKGRFIQRATEGLDALELMGRAKHISAALGAMLPAPYPEALPIILRSLPDPKAAREAGSMASFHWLPYTLFIAEQGLDDLDISLDAQRILTNYSSCEFSIRAFLATHPDRTLATLAQWTRDPDEHVRRLVSEGTRPRLPWASRLPAFQADPAPVLALLETLKDDPSEYVRRSVANNLNDISKDHPDIVISTCARWQKGASEERRRLVLHALRTLVKKGDPDAVRLAGGSDGGEFSAKATLEPARVRIGGSVRILVEVNNRGRDEATAVLGVRIHFVKASGATSPRTFKLPTVTLAAGASQTISKTISLRQHTTRTHYPGEHAVELVVNGGARPGGRFMLRAADDGA